MNNPDKFFEQFREAVRQQEEQRFPGFEQVWQQVEERLDNKHKRHAAAFPVRKLLAIAASLLLMLLLGIAIFKGMQDENSVVVTKPEAILPEAERLAPDTPTASAAIARANTAKSNSATGGRSKAVAKASQTALHDTLAATSTNMTQAAKENWVKGVVADTLGQPIAGASVSVAGTNRKVATDSSGKFSIRAEASDELAVQALGYTSKNFTVNSEGEMKLTIDAHATALSEVVVVGYGTEKKKMAAASVSAPRSESRSAQLPGALALQGRAAGVQVGGKRLSKSSDQLMAASATPMPGANTDIRIRGANSISPGNDPLFVVNGLPVNGNALKVLDPSSIQELKVLKDAAATSLYGSRASNGVVIITTKNPTNKEQASIQKMNEQWLAAGVHSEPFAIGRNNKGYDEDYSTMVENPFTSPQVSPLSTFSIDVDNASYSNIRRFINNGQPVPRDAVRIEEMINYFRYQYDAPKDKHPFAVHTELGESPWNTGHKLLRIGLKAKDIPAEQLPVSNLVFLIDVSGSMDAPNKLPLLKSSMKVLVDQLRKEDKVSIVVYAGAAGMVLPPTSGANKQDIMDAMNKLNAGGSTAGGAGIELAYKTAAENFVKEGNNRVVLATDGDFNVGINSNSDLQQMIEEKRKSGIFLTCLGFGMGNYKDSRLETLADKGNGNYAYIDNLQEANRFLGKEFKGTVFTVAKDVKLQIEFNPQVVQQYRLIGYENRLLNEEDFVNDKIDAGEMGAGHTVTALYEIIPVGVKSQFSSSVANLKYSKPVTSTNATGELATIKFRYKEPDGESSVEWSKVVSANAIPLARSSDDFRFAAAVAWFGLVLRKSDLITNKEPGSIKSLATGARGRDEDGYRAEFIRLLDASY